MRRLVIILLSILLSACGFHLRGTADLPWDTLHLVMPENNEFFAQLKRSIESGTRTRIVDDPKSAQATLTVMNNLQTKSISSLSAKGLVREYQLTRTFSFRMADAKGSEILPPSTIILQRQMTFDDVQIYAKEAEEAQIVREMQSDLIQQLLRRLSTVKPKPAG